MTADITESPIKTSSRISYFDSMRGLSMILVVLHHVFFFMDEHADATPMAAILISWRMPLFFFISGYFAYRALNRWQSSFIRFTLVRKFRAQILCTTVFYILYAYTCHKPVLGFLHEGYNQYWFTIALFQIFLLYILTIFVCKYVHRDFTGLCVLVISGLLFVCAPHWYTWHNLGNLLSWRQVGMYLPFFACGLLIHQYWTKFERLLQSDIFRTIVIIIFVAGCIYYYNDGYSRPHGFFPRFFQDQIHRATGMLTIFIFFYQRADYFNGNSPVARFLNFTGKRTLDVYMLHYFFTPHLNQFSWADTMSAPGMMIIKLSLGLTIALAVTSLCLLCSNILRSSRFLSVWLFGTK